MSVMTNPIRLSEIVPEFPCPYIDIFISVGRGFDIPWYLLAGQVAVESNFNPTAVSPKGARGLAQFMPATWREFGTGDVFNPRDNITAQAKYITWLMMILKADVWEGYWRVLASYYWGIGRVLPVKKWDSLPKGVQTYVRKCLVKAIRLWAGEMITREFNDYIG